MFNVISHYVDPVAPAGLERSYCYNKAHLCEQFKSVYTTVSTVELH